jgi:hypothetical protein
MMPWYGFIHPLLAVATLALGLATGQTSMSKLSEWDFPVRKQRYRSVIVFLLTVANFVVGLVVATALRGQGKNVRYTAHSPLAIAAMVAAMLAALASFARFRPGNVSGFIRLHPILTVLTLALILTNGFLVVWSLF